VEFGVHLPLISFASEQRSLDDLIAFTDAARDLDYRHLYANDHLVFSRPWLDGPTALAAVLPRSGQMTLATTVAVPVLRGAAGTAKILAAIDLLSGGRLMVGLGPGSSARDYELVGVPFEERWKRLDEAVQALRAYWRGDEAGFEGSFYSTAGFTLAPTPTQRPGPPIWIGSWGSPAGLRRVARLADGWLASGYNTNPELFAQAWSDVQGGGRSPRAPMSRSSRTASPRCGATSPKTVHASVRVRNASSFGRSPTSARSWKCSASASCHNSTVSRARLTVAVRLRADTSDLESPVKSAAWQDADQVGRRRRVRECAGMSLDERAPRSP
jgi:Luciferase-like monooxygenase